MKLYAIVLMNFVSLAGMAAPQTKIECSIGQVRASINENLHLKTVRTNLSILSERNSAFAEVKSADSDFVGQIYFFLPQSGRFMVASGATAIEKNNQQTQHEVFRIPELRNIEFNKEVSFPQYGALVTYDKARITKLVTRLEGILRSEAVEIGATNTLNSPMIILATQMGVFQEGEVIGFGVSDCTFLFVK